MDDCKWSYSGQYFKQILYSRPTEEIDEKMAPPTKKSKISSWRAIEYPSEDLLEMGKVGLMSWWKKSQDLSKKKDSNLVSF